MNAKLETIASEIASAAHSNASMTAEEGTDEWKSTFYATAIELIDAEPLSAADRRAIEIRVTAGLF